MRQLFIYLLILFASVLYAADEEQYMSLTLDQAIVNVLEHNPQLTAADFEA